MAHCCLFHYNIEYAQELYELVLKNKLDKNPSDSSPIESVTTCICSIKNIIAYYSNKRFKKNICDNQALLERTKQLIGILLDTLSNSMSSDMHYLKQCKSRFRAMLFEDFITRSA